MFQFCTKNQVEDYTAATRAILLKFEHGSGIILNPDGLGSTKMNEEPKTVRFFQIAETRLIL